MPIPVTCKLCHAAFSVKDTLAGKTGKCPRCRALLQVPAAAGLEQAALTEVASSRAKPVESATALMQRILGAFQGDFPCVRRTLRYRVAALFVTVAMLLLPVLYVALIGAVLVFLYWHATANGSLLRGFVIWGVIFLYAGPLIAGTILVFFMIKPLFARAAKADKGRALPFGREPLLFAFVTRVARAVRAPEPKRIEVDCEVNASAGFGSLFGHELVLTIGLPLVAGLSVQQLAGILAHELGHFAQGGGMRLSYIIRSVNHWFARVVYERDGWDEALVSWCEDSGRLAPIFYLALFCVWVTRGILWLFMALGHTLSCTLLRQMEYDADRYATRLIGSPAYEETSRRVAVLDAATRTANRILVKCLHRGQFPDDLPFLIAAGAEGMPPGKRRKIEKQLLESKTGLVDTHPAYPDRLASIRREKAAGIFHLDQSAPVLFSDFPKLARTATLDLYRKLFDKKLKVGDLVPAAAILATASDDAGLKT